MEGMTQEDLKYLYKIVELSEKDFAEGRVYTTDEVLERCKKRLYENRMVRNGIRESV